MTEDQENIVTLLRNLSAKIDDLERNQIAFMNLLRGHWKDEAARRRECTWR